MLEHVVGPLAVAQVLAPGVHLHDDLLSPAVTVVGLSHRAVVAEVDARAHGASLAATELGELGIGAVVQPHWRAIFVDEVAVNAWPAEPAAEFWRVGAVGRAGNVGVRRVECARVGARALDVPGVVNHQHIAVLGVPLGPGVEHVLDEDTIGAHVAPAARGIVSAVVLRLRGLLDAEARVFSENRIGVLLRIGRVVDLAILVKDVPDLLLWTIVPILALPVDSDEVADI